VKFDNQLRHANAIIEAYKGQMPLHAWLKSFFRDNKQMGSRDRKLLSTLVYGYYRLGHAVPALPPDERILTGLFLCHSQPHELLNYFRSDWNEKITLPLEEKIVLFQQDPSGAGADFQPSDIFPWKDQLSPGIDHHAFCLSFLRQPDLFLRIRPGYENLVREKLAAVSHQFIPPFTLRLPNGFNIEDYFIPDHEVVVQDYSSQRLADVFPPIPRAPSANPRTELPLLGSAAPSRVLSFWDACAASGGKSILAHDLYPDMHITVSDIRESILHNLKSRFHTAGIKNYDAFVADLTRPIPPATSVPSAASATIAPASATIIPTSGAKSDLILADVPCTGSGTWSRTPEELYFFNPRALIRYSEMQQQIISNVAANLAPDAWLIYSTCSVFKKENEEMVAFIGESGLILEHAGPIIGYPHQADTMFAARFRRRS
jgi:16S rRNA (cytosine967-C5)-methyltransferase